MRKTHLRSWLYREAQKGSAAVLIFLAKVELGMKEAPTTAVNVTTAIANGVPIVTEEVKRRFSEIGRIVREEAERERAAELNDAPAVASEPAVVNALVRSEQLSAETAKEAAVPAAAAPPGERLESNQLGNGEPKAEPARETRWQWPAS